AAPAGGCALWPSPTARCAPSRTRSARACSRPWPPSPATRRSMTTTSERSGTPSVVGHSPERTTTRRHSRHENDQRPSTRRGSEPSVLSPCSPFFPLHLSSPRSAKAGHPATESLLILLHRRFFRLLKTQLRLNDDDNISGGLYCIHEFTKRCGQLGDRG